MAITTQFLTGFEHGFVGSAATAGLGLFDTVSAGCTASTSSPRNGTYCARIVAPANTATVIRKLFTAMRMVDGALRGQGLIPPQPAQPP